MDSLCYIISDKQGTILAIRHHEFFPAETEKLESTLSELLSSEPLFQRPYNEILLALSFPPVTYIPNRLYKEEERKTYLDDILTEAPASEVFSDELAYLDAMVVFRLSGKLHGLIRQAFPQARICHATTAMVQYFGKLAEHKLGQKVFVNVTSRSAQIYYFDGAEMIFSNSFPFQTASDFIYYILLIYRQFDLETGKIPLFYGGMLSEDSEIYRMLYRYIRSIQPMALPTQYQWTDSAFDKLDPAWYIDLLSTAYC